jgi:hypothetical protein
MATPGGPMGPPQARAPTSGKVVLAEDSYTDAIEAIVERDFFPAIPKLRNKLEWCVLGQGNIFGALAGRRGRGRSQHGGAV